MDNIRHCFKIKSKDLKSGRLILIFLTAIISTQEIMKNEQFPIIRVPKVTAMSFFVWITNIKAPVCDRETDIKTERFFLEIEWVSE